MPIYANGICRKILINDSVFLIDSRRMRGNHFFLASYQKWAYRHSMQKLIPVWKLPSVTNNRLLEFASEC